MRCKACGSYQVTRTLQEVELHRLYGSPVILPVMVRTCAKCGDTRYEKRTDVVARSAAIKSRETAKKAILTYLQSIDKGYLDRMERVLNLNKGITKRWGRRSVNGVELALLTVLRTNPHILDLIETMSKDILGKKS